MFEVGRGRRKKEGVVLCGNVWLGTCSFGWIGGRRFRVVGDGNIAEWIYVVDEGRVPLMDVLYERMGDWKQMTGSLFLSLKARIFGFLDV